MLILTLIFMKWLFIAFVWSSNDKLPLFNHKAELTLKSENWLTPEVFIDLNVEMNYVLFMHVLQSVADLPHIANHFSFRHLVVLIGDLVEQLATRQAAQHAIPTCRSAVTRDQLNMKYSWKYISLPNWPTSKKPICKMYINTVLAH